MSDFATQRIIALVDMDCFYCQVETRLNPTLKGKPLAVVQYNQWKGGGIIAVNYEARSKGVKRGMRGDEAKEICSDIILVSVPTIRGKADLSKDAGDEVAKVFSEFSTCVQRASIDEAYLDLTKSVENFIQTIEVIKPEDLPNTYVVGHCDLKDKNEDERVRGLRKWLKQIESVQMIENANYKLAIGGIIIENMRAKILEKTGFHCSAGIAHNKILAKLTAGLHKPKKQTILPHDSVPELYETVPIYKVRNLGGKLGRQVSEKLSITHMSELYKFSMQELQQKFDEKTSSWLYNIARGIDLEPVTVRLVPESIGCCKNFTGLNQLTKKIEVEHWLRELATEISERLSQDEKKNKRRAKLLTISFLQETPMTRCGPLNSYNAERIASDALDLIKKFNSAPPGSGLWKPPIKNLGVSASKFTEEITSIEKFLKVPKTDIADEKLNRELNKSNTDETIIKSLNSNLSPEAGTSSSNVNPSRSFFLRFLNEKKAFTKEIGEEKPLENPIDDDKESAWISLSEVIPDVNEVDQEVIDILPEPLKKKFNEKLISNNNEKGRVKTELETTAETKPEVESINECPKEKCNECGQEIMLEVFLEHLDYHVAVKLSSELNKTVQPATANKPPLGNAIQGKRKSYQGKTPSKKMKSIKSFFATVPK